MRRGGEGGVRSHWAMLWLDHINKSTKEAFQRLLQEGVVGKKGHHCSVSENNEMPITDASPYSWRTETFNINISP